MQFLDGHHYTDEKDAAGNNIHRKAMGAIGILLQERSDLVKRFFSEPFLEASDIDKMIVLVYTESRDDENPDHVTFKTTYIGQVPELKLSCVI